jgi:GNAT superfamily N-acetyltransferase
MKISSVPSISPVLNRLRSGYFEYLYEPQDMHSESLIRKAASHVLWKGSDPVGYFISDDNGTLLEFYVSDERLAENAFNHMLDARSITRIICKTFDPLLLCLSIGRTTHAKRIAFHFTTIADERFQQVKTISTRSAQFSDVGSILAINDDFFDSEEEVGSYIKKGALLLYEDENELLGCGLVQPVLDDHSAYDLGMLVNPSRRRQGIGQHIIRHLKADCLSRGRRPICCCDIGNLASRACLEAAGFRSRHQTVEFSLHDCR